MKIQIRVDGKNLLSPHTELTEVGPIIIFDMRGKWPEPAAGLTFRGKTFSADFLIKPGQKFEVEFCE